MERPADIRSNAPTESSPALIREKYISIFRDFFRKFIRTDEQGETIDLSHRIGAVTVVHETQAYTPAEQRFIETVRSHADRQETVLSKYRERAFQASRDLFDKEMGLSAAQVRMRRYDFVNDGLIVEYAYTESNDAESVSMIDSVQMTNPYSHIRRRIHSDGDAFYSRSALVQELGDTIHVICTQPQEQLQEQLPSTDVLKILGHLQHYATAKARLIDSIEIGLGSFEFKYLNLDPKDALKNKSAS